MSAHQQFYSTVQLRQEWDEELAAELEARRIEAANEALAEMQASLDDEFLKELEAKYPMLRAWPGKDKK
jgi:hypothetical protein